MNFSLSRIAAAVERPVLGARDVLLLGFVQLAAIGDVRGDQLPHFFGRQRRGVVRLLEKVGSCVNPRTAADSSRARSRRGAFRLSFARHLLVLQQHRMLDRRTAPAREQRAPGRGPSFPGDLFGHEAHRRACSRAPRPRAAKWPVRWSPWLRIARGDHGRLLDPEPLRKLRRGHAERLPDSLDPSAHGRSIATDLAEVLYPLVEIGTGLCRALRPSHSL